MTKFKIGDIIIHIDGMKNNLLDFFRGQHFLVHDIKISHGIKIVSYSLYSFEKNRWDMEIRDYEEQFFEKVA